MKESKIKIIYDYETKEKKYLEYCNLCENTTFVKIANIDRYGYPAITFACRECGLTFLNPVMTSTAYSEFYMKFYRPILSAYHGRIYDASSIQNDQYIYAQKRIDYLKYIFELKKWQTIKMLDIGGSTGVVANEFFKKMNINATVIDPAPLELDVAQKLGLKTITGLVEDFDTDEKFNFITLFQTVDHLLDISKTLEKVRSLLIDEGLFYVDIVDFKAAYTKKGSITESIKIDHPYYLTRSTIEMYLEKFGFKILGVEFHDDGLHVGYICEVLKNWQPENGFKIERAEVRDYFNEIRTIQNTNNHKKF